MSNWIDTEQQILKCMDVLEDLATLAEANEHDDKLCDKLYAIKEVYQLRFDKLWGLYEKSTKDFYGFKAQAEKKTK